jgi:hypothetical protein
MYVRRIQKTLGGPRFENSYLKESFVVTRTHDRIN